MYTIKADPLNRCLYIELKGFMDETEAVKATATLKSEASKIHGSFTVINDIREYKELDFFRTKYFKRLVIDTLALFGFIILFFKYKEEIVSNQSEYLRIWIYIIALSITIATAKWSYNRFKKDKRKTIEHKTALLKKLGI